MGATLKGTKWCFKTKITCPSFFLQVEPQRRSLRRLSLLFLCWPSSLSRTVLGWFLQIGSNSAPAYSCAIHIIHSPLFSNSYHTVWFPTGWGITREGVQIGFSCYFLFPCCNLTKLVTSLSAAPLLDGTTLKFFPPDWRRGGSHQKGVHFILLYFASV